MRDIYILKKKKKIFSLFFLNIPSSIKIRKRNIKVGVIQNVFVHVKEKKEEGKYKKIVGERERKQEYFIFLFFEYFPGKVWYREYFQWSLFHYLTFLSNSRGEEPEFLLDTILVFPALYYRIRSFHRDGNVAKERPI